MLLRANDGVPGREPTNSESLSTVWTPGPFGCSIRSRAAIGDHQRESAMHRHILAVIAASAATFSLVGAPGHAEAGPAVATSGVARTGAVLRGAPRFHKTRYGHRNRFSRGRFVAATAGTSGDRYLAESAWFLSDTAGFLASPDELPAYGSYGYGYGYPFY